MLDHESLRALLSAVATGYADRAVNVVATAEGLEMDERQALATILEEGAEPSVTARRVGDLLRSLGVDRTVVNEYYRVAFYLGDGWKELSSNPLFAYFTANRAGQPLDKWIHYFPIYDRHLAHYRGAEVRVLEIGVYRGGGLDLLRHYLGPAAHIVGIDIDEAAARAVGGRHPVELGDQSDPDFLRSVATRHGPFDIVIDDGGHTMRQQITAVETLFPLLAEGGTYVVEDSHTSYWPEYADMDGGTFIGWLKERIDDLHAYHHSTARDLAEPWQVALAALHVYDSVAVLERSRRFAPFSEITGTAAFVHHTREAAANDLELLATRDAAIAQAAAANARVDEELRALRGELMDARARGGQLQAELDDLNTDFVHLREQLHGSWGIIEEMRRSASWRATAPLRRVKSVLRGR